MAWNFSGDRTIYIQLVETLQRRIVAGFYTPGQRIGSVRELATEAAVNPNTMQRALTELERLELVHSRRTSGRFVTDDPQRIEKLRITLALEEGERFFAKMKELGFRRRESLDFLCGVEASGEKEENRI